MSKVRLDVAVAEKGHVTRSRARSLIIAGRVRVDGRPLTKPGFAVDPAQTLEIERPRPYVSRGGEKLEAALDAFDIDTSAVERALDVGASTGGFTDCLLARGVAHVVALDVGYGQLAWQLRGDPRVTVVERTNFRTLPDDAFPGGFDLIVIDASFISLRLLLERARTHLRADGSIVALVKPQFEAGRERVEAGGVVRSEQTHRAVLGEFRESLAPLGLSLIAAIVSPLRGPAGNVEFFVHLRSGSGGLDDASLDRLVGEAHF
ncbi:MAG: TlyA family RNA methyltransferase [Candidatus Eremiobacteraeota bacterium]|nr:TlyA family RNA methyltransferase [Candidatus Eremiobacteraeota bacterium]